MPMSEIKIETAFWVFSLVVCCVIALFPERFFHFLGRGRVTASPRTFLVFRVLAVFCFLGFIYRILWLHQQLAHSR